MLIKGKRTKRSLWRMFVICSPPPNHWDHAQAGLCPYQETAARRTDLSPCHRHVTDVSPALAVQKWKARMCTHTPLLHVCSLPRWGVPRRPFKIGGGTARSRSTAQELLKIRQVCVPKFHRPLRSRAAVTAITARRCQEGAVAQCGVSSRRHGLRALPHALARWLHRPTVFTGTENTHCF